MYTQIANKLRTFAIILLIASIVFCSIGFYKKDVYDGDGYFSPNAYVGGDAYNYIINGTYFAGYCVLGGCAFISSILSYGISQFFVAKEYEEKHKDEQQAREENDQAEEAEEPNVEWDETLPKL